MANDQVEKLMKALGCSESEALDIIATDKEIDQGKRVYFDLDKDKEKAAKKLANVGTRKRPTVYKFEKKQPKANPTKEGLIAEIAEFLTNLTENGVENVEIVNKSKLITFKIGEKSFKLDLIEQRKPKS